MVTEKRIAEVRAYMEAVIAARGWVVRAIFPTAGNPGPTFSYTVGLHDKGLPELIVFGLSGQVSEMLLSDIADRCLHQVAEGRPIPTGLVDLENWPMPSYLLAADTPQAEEFATFASDRSQGAACYVQVFFPDTQGLYPWDSHCNETIRALQPLLGPAPGSAH